MSVHELEDPSVDVTSKIGVLERTIEVRNVLSNVSFVSHTVADQLVGRHQYASQDVAAQFEDLHVKVQLAFGELKDILGTNKRSLAKAKFGTRLVSICASCLMSLLTLTA